MTIGETCVFQVAAVVGGGEATHSARVSVEYVTDTTAPAVSKLEFTSDAGCDSYYAERDDVEVTVTFRETVFVTGTP